MKQENKTASEAGGEFKDLQFLVVQWGKERDLYHPEHGATPDSQFLKFGTEIEELCEAIIANDRVKIKDGIGDAIVCHISKLELEGDYGYMNMIDEDYVNLCYSDNEDVLTPAFIIGHCLHSSYKNSIESIFALLFLEKLLGFEYLECLKFAYNEIKDRKGRMINRTFVKEQ